MLIKSWTFCICCHAYFYSKKTYQPGSVSALTLPWTVLHFSTTIIDTAITYSVIYSLEQSYLADLDFNIVSRLDLQRVPASTAWVLIFRQDCRLPQNYSHCGPPGNPVSSSSAPFFINAKGLWPFLAACDVCPLHCAIPWPFRAF